MNLSVRYLGISHDDCNKNEKTVKSRWYAWTSNHS
jgi:hypothetical protein